MAAPNGTTPALERVLASAPGIRLAAAPRAGTLEAVETETGLTLPGAIRDLLAAHDGEASGSAGLLLGLHLMPVEEALAAWRSWQEPEVAELYPEATSLPPGMVREVGASAGWFPLGHDGSGNHIGVDLDPGPLGTSGQIISFGADDDEHYCYARDLDAFLIRVAELLESGDAVIDDRGWRFPASRNRWSPIDLFV